MDCDEGSSRYGHGPNFVGAIFMCNRTTKKECLKRKLFGLPMSQAGFVKKVKTGMFLFLFEYERRELYGVFEATTDGAINVVPGAYSKTGSSFPAQVHFRSLWICDPLSEDEFRDAIHENYYALNKFNFGLSFKQVAKLVELFDLKKISSVDTTEQHALNNRNAKSRLDAHHSMRNENPDLVLENPNVRIEHRSYPRVPSGLQPQLSNTTHSTSPIDHAREESYLFDSKSPFHGQPSDVLGAGKPNFAQTLTEIQALHLRTHSYPSYPDSESYNFSATKYYKQGSFDKLGVDVPNSTPWFTETQVPPSSSNSFLLEQGLGTLRSYSYPSQQAPLGLINTYGYAEASKETDSARGMRYWKLLPNNPNLPLVDNDLPSRLPSRYSSEPCDVIYNKEEDHYFPKGSSFSSSSKVKSEMFQRRTSVFSRLSKAPKIFSSGDDVRNANKNSFPRLNDDGNRILENMEQVDAELASASAIVNDESIELPFFNFKRRSGAKNVVDKTEGTCKRRKLIRPSFTENDLIDNENKGTSALDASLGNREHMNPRDNVESC